MEPVLLVIDMQNDFCNPGGAMDLSGVEEILPEVAQAVRTAHAAKGRVVFTRDLHTSEDPEFERSPTHCVEGTWGSELLSEMPAEKGDILLSKRTPNAFLGTHLCRILEGKFRPSVTGIAAELGVLQMASEAVMRGIEAILQDRSIGIPRLGERAAMYHLEGMLPVPRFPLSWSPAFLGCS